MTKVSGEVLLDYATSLHTNYYARHVQAMARELIDLRAKAAAGKLVPREPTIFERRCLEGKVGIDWLEGWKSMLAAAPEAEKL